MIASRGLKAAGAGFTSTRKSGSEVFVGLPDIGSAPPGSAWQSRRLTTTVHRPGGRLSAIPWSPGGLATCSIPVSRASPLLTNRQGSEATTRYRTPRPSNAAGASGDPERSDTAKIPSEPMLAGRTCAGADGLRCGSRRPRARLVPHRPALRLASQVVVTALAVRDETQCPTTVTSVLGSSSRARNAALMPASLPPMAMMCICLPSWWARHRDGDDEGWFVWCDAWAPSSR